MTAPAAADEFEDVMVVTASGTQQSIKDAPASVTVITAEELQKDIGKSATDLADVLEQVAGISKAINTDVSSGIQIRGMPGAYTLLLVDGKRVSSSNGIKSTQQNYFDDINWVPIESIERIEIVRGPMSALYGSDAMGGVVNIITKKNKDKWSGSMSIGTRQPEGSKRGDTTTYTGTIGGPLGNGFSIRLNGSWDKRNADKSDTSSLRWGSGREGKKRYNYGAALDWDINDNHKLSVEATRGQEEGIKGSSASSTEINLRGITELKREGYSADYTGLFDIGSVKLSAYQNKYENFASGVSIISDGVVIGEEDTFLWSKDRVVEGNVNIPFDFLVPHSLTLGGQWMKEELNNPRSIGATAGTSTYGSHFADATSNGWFIEDQLGLMDDLTLTLGMRYDDTEYGNESTPRAYLVYQTTDYLTLKGGYSEGFKTPTLRQASQGFIETSSGAACNGYADYISGTRCYTTGSGDIKPEKSESWEFSALFDYKGWKAELTFFDNRFHDKIASSPVGYINGDTSTYWMERINLDTARTQGVEGKLDIPLVREPLGPLLNTLTLRNNFTRMIKAEDNLGVMLVTTPKFTSYSSLDWSVNEKLSFAFTAHYYGKMLGLNNAADQSARSNTATARIRNSYFIYDLSGQYKATKNLKFSAGIANLFDKDPVSENPAGSATSGNNYYVPGRTIYATMTTSF